MSSTGTLRLPPHRRPVPTRTRLRTRRIPLAGYVVALLLVPIAVLFAAHAGGWWVTSGHTLPGTALGGQLFGAPAAGAGTPGALSGGAGAAPADPSEIRGSLTLQQLLDAFPQVSAADVSDFFGAPADTPTSTELRSMARDGNGREIADLRAWVAQRAPGK